MERQKTKQNTKPLNRVILKLMFLQSVRCGKTAGSLKQHNGTGLDGRHCCYLVDRRQQLVQYPNFRDSSGL